MKIIKHIPGCGHAVPVIHVRVCRSDPVHRFPPYAGRGFVHERRRSCVPLLHIALHRDQRLHSEYPPSTKTEGKQKIVDF